MTTPPDPYVTRNDDGTITLFWPEGLQFAPVAREILEAQVAEHNELAALKARRCDGCANWTPLGRGEWGDCAALGDSTVGMVNDMFVLSTTPDHYCAAWAPKEPQP